MPGAPEIERLRIAAYDDYPSQGPFVRLDLAIQAVRDAERRLREEAWNEGYGACVNALHECAKGMDVGPTTRDILFDAVAMLENSYKDLLANDA